MAPPRKSLGICRRVTNKGKSGFGKANDRVEAKEQRPSGIPVEVWWGALSVEGRKLDRCSKVIIGFPVSIRGVHEVLSIVSGIGGGGGEERLIKDLN